MSEWNQLVQKRQYDTMLKITGTILQIHILCFQILNDPKKMIPFPAMIILISLAMIIDQILTRRGMVYLSESWNQDGEAEKIASEKHEEIGTEPNFEHRTAELKEKTYCIKIQGIPDVQGWVVDICSRGGYTIE